MTKRVIEFTSACCTGWCYGFEADDFQYKHLLKIVEDYNSPTRWTEERSCDGTAHPYASVVEFLEAFNSQEQENGEPPADSLVDAYARYEDDGEGKDTSLAFVLLALVSNGNDSWPPEIEPA